MRILFITATRLGDAVLSTGLIEHLRLHHPKARFSIACGPVAAGLFDRLPGRDATLVVEKQRHDLHWLKLWTRCVGTRWDLAIDLRGSAVTLLLPARRRRIMRGGRRPGHRLTHLAGVLDLPAPPPPIVWTNEADRARAAGLLPAGAVFIGLGPTANWSGKVWPADRFAEVFKALARDRPGLRPAIFMGPGETERAMAAPLRDALAPYDPVLLGGGALSLPEVAACLARCALFIGNDSGLMHLAGAAGAPVLGLFGPSRVSEYGPTGPRSAAVVAPGPDGEAPIAGLATGTVIEAALGLLGRAS